MLTQPLCLPAAAKSKAEFDFANARTQQEAEQAEQAIRDATAFLKDALRVKVSARSLRKPTDWRAHCLLRAVASGAACAPAFCSGRAAVLTHIANALFLLLRASPKAPAVSLLCSCLPAGSLHWQTSHKVPRFRREGADHRCLHVFAGAPAPGG